MGRCSSAKCFPRKGSSGLEDDHAAKADKQTRDTREIFGIADAIVVPVILNESAPTLHPDLVRYGLQHVFQKKAPDGSFRYRHNDGVVVISEAHTMTGSGRGMPCFSALAPQWGERGACVRIL